MVDLDGLRGALRTGWHRAPERLVPLGGPGGCGWEVQIGGERYVASLTGSERLRVEAGLAAVPPPCARGADRLAAARAVLATAHTMLVPSLAD